MKPIYLEWSAFGPFADKVVLELEQLLSEGVFLVHGATGAGKTTIFDAISFALFGNASGEYRQVDSFRSDFAKDDIKTYVILQFSHNGSNYRVERSPAYRRRKQRGEGYTESKAEAVLCMPDGSKIVGYQTVTEKIEEILSVDWKQFKQISMIAQGEFLKLLTLESKERGEIFRNVFHTENLERIGKQLKEKMLTIKRNYEEIERSLNQYYHTIECPTDRESLQRKETASIKEIPRILSDFIEMDRVAQVVCKEQITKLEQTITYLQLKEVKQQQAWEIYQNAKKDTKELLNLIEKKEEVVKDLKTKEEQIVLFYQKAQADKMAIEQLVIRIEQLKLEQIRLQEKEEQEQKYAKKENEVLFLQEEVQRQQRIIEKKEEQIKECQKKKEKLTDTIQKGRELEQREKELKQEIEQLKIWAQHFETYANLRQSYEQLVEEITNRLEKQQKDVIELQKLETLYTCEQAGILALELKKGKPCPVCGSLIHPKPAIVSYFVPKREELEEKRMEYEYSRKRIEELGKEAASKKASFEFLLQQMDLPNDISMEQLIEEREQLEILRAEQLKEVEEQLEVLVQQQEESICAKEEEKVLETEITKELLILRNLQEKHQKLKIEQETLRHTIQRIEKECTCQTVIQVQQTLKEVEEEQNRKKQEIYFAEQNYKDFNKQSQNEEVILEQLLKQKLTYFQKEQKAWEEYEKEVLIKADDHTIAKEISLLLEEKEKQQKQYTNQVARLQQNEKILEQILLQLEKQKELEKQYSEVAILSQVANGELVGKEKLPFEQYVQAFYLEQVIEEANLRLKRMSGGRFALLRRQEAENKRSVTGLDLEVMDYFTGKARSVKSLSGGESFKAALCLALGLSDVIQKYAGGIVVETMFIDEGFGSLDKDSLEQAISILKDLAMGHRMIGIISHVEELKECIEKKIVVTKGMCGSTIQMQT